MYQKIFSLLFLIVVLVDGLFAQKTETYDSIYRPTEDLVGNAVFNYYTQGGRKVIDGDFKFENFESNSEANTRIEQNEWNGKYVEGVKTGKWTYERTLYNLEINGIENDELLYNLNPAVEITTANYMEGLPNGVWTYEYLVDNFTDTLARWTAEFKGGKLDGKLRIVKKAMDSSDTRIEIEGVAQKGLMDGKWIFTTKTDSTERIETRYYNMGILTRLLVEENGSFVKSVQYPLSPGMQTFVDSRISEIAFTENPVSLVFNDGYPNRSIQITSQQFANDYLERWIDQIYRFDSDMMSQIGLPFGVVRGIYPVSESEEQRIGEWLTLEADFRELLNQMELKFDENFTYTKDSTLLSIQKWKQHQDSILPYYRSWSSILAKENVQYYYRKGLLVNYAEDVLDADQIIVQGDTVEYVYSDKTDLFDDFLEVIYVLTERRLKKGKALLEKYQERKSELDLKTRITANRQELEIGINRLDSIFSSSSNANNFQPELEYIKTELYRSKFQSHYNKYRTQDNFTPEREQAIVDTLVHELNLIESMYNKVLNLDLKVKQIDTLYTELTFDPFTYSDNIPTRVKKRFYELTMNKLLSDIRTAILNSSSIDEANRYFAQIERLLKRMEYYVDKDTRKMEKRLRRANTIEERMALLNEN